MNTESSNMIALNAAAPHSFWNSQQPEVEWLTTALHDMFGSLLCYSSNLSVAEKKSSSTTSLALPLIGAKKPLTPLRILMNAAPMETIKQSVRPIPRHWKTEQVLEEVAADFSPTESDADDGLEKIYSPRERFNDLAKRPRHESYKSSLSVEDISLPTNKTNQNSTTTEATTTIIETHKIGPTVTNNNKNPYTSSYDNEEYSKVVSSQQTNHDTISSPGSMRCDINNNNNNNDTLNNEGRFSKKSSNAGPSSGHDYHFNSLSLTKKDQEKQSQYSTNITSPTRTTPFDHPKYTATNIHSNTVSQIVAAAVAAAANKPEATAPAVVVKPSEITQKSSSSSSTSSSKLTPEAFGIHWFNDAMKRLELPCNPSAQVQRLHSIANPTNLDSLSKQQQINNKDSSTTPIKKLETEKALIKSELKEYDRLFCKEYGHWPNHSEKEPLRVLYTYYRRVKLSLERAKRKTSLVVPVKREGDLFNTDATETNVLYKSNVRLEEIQQLSIEQNSLKSNSFPALSSPQPKKETVPPPLQNCGSKDFSEDELRLIKLQEEKMRIRMKLQEFQELFLIKEGRPIRYHRDIVLVENEYKQYKIIREEINRLSEKIRRKAGLQTLSGKT